MVHLEADKDHLSQEVLDFVQVRLLGVLTPSQTNHTKKAAFI